ncbi:uncharacterized protein [Palaemon carinicauda]|uniref:uncharacterized protein n=1 Tax=Palaemon carinicauda TaxID=392227 RepID=UPI0035B6631D
MQRKIGTCRTGGGNKISNLAANKLLSHKIDSKGSSLFTSSHGSKCNRGKCETGILGPTASPIIQKFTRGIHIELVKDLSCDSYLMVFRKFCSRRGFPSLMQSDNATTFVSTPVYLKIMAESSLVQEHLNAKECKWNFIPARAPWFGAIWERLIGLLKTCLKKVIGQAFLGFSELSCIVTELEAIIDDRPLSYTPGNLDQLDILTPNHLILGRRLRSFPREVIDWKDETKDPLYGENKDVGKRFLFITKKCNDLWKRWERDYLTSLRETQTRILAQNGRCCVDTQ